MHLLFPSWYSVSNIPWYIYTWNGFSSTVNTFAFPLLMFCLKCSPVYIYMKWIFGKNDQYSWFKQSFFTFMKIWTIKSIQLPLPSDALSQKFPGINAWNGFLSRINTVAFPPFLYFLKCSAAVGYNSPKAPLPKTQCKYTLLRRRMILALTSYAVSICASAKENIFACVAMHTQHSRHKNFAVFSAWTVSGIYEHCSKCSENRFNKI